MLICFCICILPTVPFNKGFDPDLTVIPNSFKGDHIVQVAKSLDIKPGECESTASDPIKHLVI